MRKYKSPLFVLLVILCISCSDKNDVIDCIVIDNENKIVLSSEEYTSIAYDNPQELKAEHLNKLINDFIDIQSKMDNALLTKSGNVSITSVKKYYINSDDNIENTTNTRSHSYGQFNIPIFEVELSNNNHRKDFTVICGDERAPEVLFYVNDYYPESEMNPETRFLLELSKKSILSDIEFVEQIRMEKRESTLQKISDELQIPREQLTFDLIKDQILILDGDLTKANNPVGGLKDPPARIVSFVNPMSRVFWHQGEPYNHQMPEYNILDTETTYYWGNVDVGCANVAIGTLFTIIQPAMTGITKNDRSILIDWDYVTSEPYIWTDDDPSEGGSPARMVEMVGSLLRRIYIDTKSKIDYTNINSKDKEGNTVNVHVATSTGTDPELMLDYLRKMTNFSSGTFSATQAKKSLTGFKPVLLYGNGYFVKEDFSKIDPKDPKGHAFLLDGYFLTQQPGLATQSHYWSTNMGWGRAISRGYFKTESNINNCDISFRDGNGQIIMYYTQDQRMVYNISKK